MIVSRWLELTRGWGVSRGLGSLELMFPELSGKGKIPVKG